MAPFPSQKVRPQSHWATLTTNELSRRQADPSDAPSGNWRAHATNEELVIESWSQGLIVGALLIMACITVANMRRGVLLHKLILIELLLAMSHGTFCFMSFDGYGWYLSSTAALLYCSWIIHNVVSWLKVRPFFSHPGGFFRPASSKWVRRIYIGSLCLSVPVIAFQISDNFRFFNNRGGWYPRVRPYEPLMRDPWWIFTALTLFHVIRKCYGTGVIELIRRSPRFGILLCAIFLSIVFTACDVAASISSTSIIGGTEGINPWWKLSLVFKCLTDTIMLDDFKTELKKLGIKWINKEDKRRNTISLVPDHHPLDAQASDDEETSNGGVSEGNSVHWYRTSPLVRSSTADDISPTTSARKPHGDLDTPFRSAISKPVNDPDASMDELEFSTVLSLGPSRLFGVGSVRETSCNEAEGPYSVVERRNRDHERRNSHTDHTTRISHLPTLNSRRFESIKPGKSASRSAAHLFSSKSANPPNSVTLRVDPKLTTQVGNDERPESGPRPSERLELPKPGQAGKPVTDLDDLQLMPGQCPNTSNGLMGRANIDDDFRPTGSLDPVGTKLQFTSHKGRKMNDDTKMTGYLDNASDDSDASAERVRRFKKSIGA